MVSMLKCPSQLMTFNRALSVAGFDMLRCFVSHVYRLNFAVDRFSLHLTNASNADQHKITQQNSEF
jgi:hypothetical protein